ncbi:inhibitor of growth protein 5-like isoform X1, partial [Aphis craccivora]
MASAHYLEHYLDSLESLPVELQRNFTLMRDLDSRAQTLMCNIDKQADDYLSNVKGYAPDKKTEALSSIQRQFDKAKEYGDDKVQLAIQTYELSLPVELQRNFTLMRDLDSRAQTLMCNIDKQADDYLSNVKGYAPNKKTEALSSIQRQFDKAKEYGDDKVQLAIQTYELVDKHIRKLDSELARFEAEIQDKSISTARNIEGNSQKLGCKKTKGKDIKKKNLS